MLKAEQNALIQEVSQRWLPSEALTHLLSPQANKQLLTIRREELEYFVSVFSE